MARAIITKVRISSNTIGPNWKNVVLKIVANEPEPLEAILIIFPVSLFTWKSML
jgi:hypothetical protein